jgi:putative ABC transport system permease protein
MSGQEFNENLQAAIATLNARKFRSFLTLLGVVIGVTSVIAVASIINGLNRYVSQRVEKLGSRTYFVSRIQFAPGVQMSEKIRKRRYFEPDYAAKLRERCPSLDVVSIMGTRAAFFGDPNEIRYGAESVERILVRGAEPEYIEALPIHEIIAGRFLSQFDLDHSRRVAVLGKGISDSLFGPADPIGKEVSLNGKPYEVIGVFGQDTGFFGGPGIDQFVVIPFTQYVKEYPMN